MWKLIILIRVAPQLHPLLLHLPSSHKWIQLCTAWLSHRATILESLESSRLITFQYSNSKKLLYLCHSKCNNNLWWCSNRWCSNQWWTPMAWWFSSPWCSNQWWVPMASQWCNSSQWCSSPWCNNPWWMDRCNNPWCHSRWFNNHWWMVRCNHWWKDRCNNNQWWGCQLWVECKDNLELVLQVECQLVNSEIQW